MRSVLEISRATAGYGSVSILRELSLSMPSGENIGLFGPNGHGKTTLMRVISGLVPLQSGSISFQGQSISGKSPSRIVTSGLVHVPQGNTLFGDMTVGETIEMAAFTRRARSEAGANRDRLFTLFPGLAERRSQKVKTLSGGERQMLSIGAALMCAPLLLMLDEPTLGLSPSLKERLSDALAAISKDVPILVVEQDVQLLLGITDRLFLIENGEVTRCIEKSEAPDHHDIMAMYFGEQA